ncbi:GntR family transcriptional regulator [Variovorax sp. WS11]|uniref:GntR family transcriptional regulator n=1 Tax=Variovorax sp. WS11 TaxID=1105204 RepID=UPI000D0CC5D0|nr:GntR family transcriptional regulator [Variovorax sp. WS11]NDZ15479.1 GntR family transcriptional regulator [Variovorax sp. WS11]PSL84833.1 GntR family transcriptional regulator [Variovorax sp. WS11]
MATDAPATRLALLAARRILDQAIAGRVKPGDRLTELALTTKLGISRTPVRAALAFLHRRGLLDHAPNRGYSLAAPPSELLRVQRTLPQDEADSFYYQLLRERTAGHIGAQVTERELEQAYGVRATLVREVLVRMLQHGIVRGRRGQRWEFAEALDADSERESYRFRMVLECAALAEPGFRMDPERLAACRQRQQALIHHATKRSWLDFFEANAEFHELLAASSGNRFMLKAVEEQNRLRRISDLSDYPLVSVERLRESCEEHLAILMAIERGRLKEAAQLMRAHLQGASDILEKRVAGTLVAPAPAARA